MASGLKINCQPVSAPRPNKAQNPQVKFKGNFDEEQEFDSFDFASDQEYKRRKTELEQLKQEAKTEKSKPLKTMLNISIAVSTAGIALFAFNKSLNISKDMFSHVKDRVSKNNTFKSTKNKVVDLTNTVKLKIGKAYKTIRRKIFQNAKPKDARLARFLKNSLLRTEKLTDNIKTKLELGKEKIKPHINKKTVGKALEGAGGASVAAYAGIETLQEVSKIDGE